MIRGRDFGVVGFWGFGDVLSKLELTQTMIHDMLYDGGAP